MLNPYLLYIKIGLVAALVAGLIGGYGVWHHKIYQEGYDQANSVWILKEKTIKDKAEAALQQKNEEVRLKQKSIDDVAQQIADKDKELDNAKTNFTALRAQYVTGVKRLSITRPSGATDHAQQTDHSTTASRTDQNPVTMPDFATAIIDLGRGYSENLRMKNECIDEYNSVREKINGETP